MSRDSKPLIVGVLIAGAVFAGLYLLGEHLTRRDCARYPQLDYCAMEKSSEAPQDLRWN